MTIEDFEAFVDAHYKELGEPGHTLRDPECGYCPLGLAIKGCNPRPPSGRASDVLGLPWHYCQGIIHGWEAGRRDEASRTSSRAQDEFDHGFEFGKRIRDKQLTETA